MYIKLLILATVGTASLLIFIFWWNRERIKRAISQREQKQMELDNTRNAEANKKYHEKIKNIPNVIGVIDPDDPWAGVR